MKKSEQVFIRIKDKDRKRFLKKLAAYKDMTVHQIWLRGEYYGWNADFTEMVPFPLYAALLSYTT